MKDMIMNNVTVRLYGADRETKGIRRDASQYGFEGLIITPVVEMGEVNDGAMATAIITSETLESIGVTEDEMFAAAIKNTKYEIKTMREILISSMFPDGVPENDPMVDMMFPPEDEGTQMYVISTPSRNYGAGAIIPATKELIERFPNGYTVLPSSIHEVIIIPKYGNQNPEAFNYMVREINAEVVAKEDRLSDDIYEIYA